MKTRLPMLIAGWFLIGLAAQAQPVAAPDNFGTQDGIYLWIPVSQFSGEPSWSQHPLSGEGAGLHWPNF